MKKILITLLILCLVAASPLAMAEYYNQKYTVTASCLNVRQAPGTYSKIVGGLPRGSVVNGGQSTNGWTPILYNNTNSYVCSKYITSCNTNQNTNSNYSQADLDLLARVVHAEAGSDWLTDEHQRAVASVVLNRVADSRFPNTLNGVVYQKGQYACIGSGMINYTPSQRATDNAKYVLENGTTIPNNVVWQSQVRQGNGVWKYIQGHYFCY